MSMFIPGKGKGQVHANFSEQMFFGRPQLPTARQNITHQQVAGY